MMAGVRRENKTRVEEEVGNKIRIEIGKLSPAVMELMET